MTQTRIDAEPVPSTAAELKGDWDKPTQAIVDEIYWLRKELEDLRHTIEEFNRVMFDNTTLIGMFAQGLRDMNERVEEWVGVAEE